MKGLLGGRRGRGKPPPPTVPKLFVCPILLDVMTDPATTACGHMFEHDAIVNWIRAVRRSLRVAPHPHPPAAPLSCRARRPRRRPSVPRATHPSLKTRSDPPRRRLSAASPWATHTAAHRLLAVSWPHASPSRVPLPTGVPSTRCPPPTPTPTLTAAPRHVPVACVPWGHLAWPVG
jgi:hypothetical protein